MTKRDEAYEYIKKEIVSGKLKPNEPIREREIAETSQISRTPIREALRDLEAEGVVVSFPVRGTFVAPITPYDVEEIFDLRSILEAWALERGIKKISVDEIASIRTAFLEADQSDDWDKIHNADLYLHRVIVEKSGSKRLLNFMKNLNTQIERISISSAADPIRKRETLEEHMAILDAIEKQDLKNAVKLLKEHLKMVAKAAIEDAKTII